jgi:hypothetical protein
VRGTYGPAVEIVDPNTVATLALAFAVPALAFDCAPVRSIAASWALRSPAATRSTTTDKEKTMSSGAIGARATGPRPIALGLATLVAGAALALAGAARGDSTPIGPLPPGPVSTIATSPSQLVAIALPHASKTSGLVWRLARRYDSHVVREISEADVDANVVVVFKVLSRGKTSLVFALTRGDTSSKAVRSATHKILSR